MSLELTVDKNGFGDYVDVASAIYAVKCGEAATIHINNGIYREKLVVDKPNITLVGQDKENTVLIYNDGALKTDTNGEQIGTYKTASVHVLPSATGFEAYNLTIANDAGIGSTAGQAVALYLDCDKAIVKDCRLIAKQDTLLTAPMHLDIETRPETINRQLFKDCYIEGDVDFIFGGAVALFEDCTIYCLERDRDLPCYVTAACTSHTLKYGYVFKDCHITGSAFDGHVYLGRPWRENANVAYISCSFDKCVNEQGFCVWGKTDRHLTANYVLCNCNGDGYNEAKLVDWCRVLPADSAVEYSRDKIFNDWLPDIKKF
jgi:pectinesterase